MPDPSLRPRRAQVIVTAGFATAGAAALGLAQMMTDAPHRALFTIFGALILAAAVYFFVATLKP